MSTTTTVVILAIVVVIAIVGAVLVTRTRRRRAQASEQLGLPPLGALSGEPIDKVTASRVAPEEAPTQHANNDPSGAESTKPQPEQ